MKKINKDLMPKFWYISIIVDTINELLEELAKKEIITLENDKADTETTDNEKKESESDK